MYEGTFSANTENTNPACLYDRLSILHRKESLIMRRFQKQTLDRENSQSGIQNSHEEALLNQLLSELQLENRISPGKKQRYRRVLLRQYVVKHAARLACLVFAAALLAPGTVVPASVSEVSAAPASDASSVQVSFRVDGLIPVREITAQINEHSLSVESSSYQNYQITVEENGYLLLDIYSATGLHSSHSMEQRRRRRRLRLRFHHRAAGRQRSKDSSFQDRRFHRMRGLPGAPADHADYHSG